MSNWTEVERIVKKHLASDIWSFKRKKGWANNLAYRKSEVDPHNFLIKLGQGMERIYPDVARLRYPGSLFPRSVAGHGVTEQEAKEYFSKLFNSDQSLQRNNSVIILTRLNSDKLKGFLAEEVDKLSQKKKCDRVRLGQKGIKKLAKKALKEIPLENKIREVFVDICPRIGSVYTLMEVKMSGNTDKGKTRDMLIYNMLEPYVCIGEKPKELYFGVLANNLGLNRLGEWKGQLSAFVKPELILIEEDLFNLVAPIGMSFQEFTEIIGKRTGRCRPTQRRRTRGK